MLEMTDLWVVCHGKVYAGSGNVPRERNILLSKPSYIRFRVTGFEVCSAGTILFSSSISSLCPNSSIFEIVIYILCHCISEVYNLFSHFTAGCI